ncbi:MAG: hypothetical protein ACI8ZM_001067 [Crocinitomix sp.]
MLTYILADIETSENEVENLVNDLSKKEVLYSFSDLIQRVAKDAIYNSINDGKPFSLESFKESLARIEPSPIIN